MDETKPPEVIAPHPQPQVLQTPPHHKFPKFALVVFFLLILTAIGVSLFLYLNKQTTSFTASPSPTPARDATEEVQAPRLDTTNWKTFNSKNGYSFKYPSEWFVSDYEINTDIKANYTFISSTPGLGDTGNRYTDDPDIFSMNITFDPDKRSTLEDVYQTMSKKQTQDYNYSEYKTGNNSGYKVRLKVHNYEYNYVLTENDERVYRLELLTPISKYKPYFDQILSTFQFLDAESNPKSTLGIQYVVPPGWTKEYDVRRKGFINPSEYITDGNGCAVYFGDVAGGGGPSSIVTNTTEVIDGHSFNKRSWKKTPSLQTPIFIYYSSDDKDLDVAQRSIWAWVTETGDADACFNIIESTIKSITYE